MSASAEASILTIPVLAVGAVGAGVVMAAMATVALATTAKNFLDEMESELEHDVIIPNELFDLESIPTNHLVDSTELQSHFERISNQSATLFQNHQPKQQIQAEQLILAKAVKKLPLSLLNSEQVISATQSLKAAQTSLQMDVAKNNLIHALKANNLVVQKQTLSHVMTESGKEIGFPMKLVQTKDNTIRLIGKNKTSQKAIVAELRIDQHDNISIQTEILNGGCDETCVNTIKSFQNSMEKRGIKFGNKSIQDRNRLRNIAQRQKRNIIRTRK